MTEEIPRNLADVLKKSDNIIREDTKEEKFLKAKYSEISSLIKKYTDKYGKELNESAKASFKEELENLKSSYNEENLEK